MRRLDVKHDFSASEGNRVAGVTARWRRYAQAKTETVPPSGSGGAAECALMHERIHAVRGGRYGEGMGGDQSVRWLQFTCKPGGVRRRGNRPALSFL